MSTNLSSRDLGEKSGSVQVLERAAEVLDCFSAEKPALRIADLRAMTGLPNTTCQRIVRTLVEENLLQREGDHYRIGLRVLVWTAAATAKSALLAAAGPLIRQLRDTTNETACLFVRQGVQRVIVDIAESRHSIIFRGYVGEALPLGAGAAGKVFLAWEADALAKVEQDAVEGGTFPANVVPDQLDRHLAAGRQRGYFYASQEREIGLSSIAAPVFGPNDRLIAAVAIGAPSFRLTDEMAIRLGPEVAATTTALSHALGWSGETSTTGEVNVSDLDNHTTTKGAK